MLIRKERFAGRDRADPGLSHVLKTWSVVGSGGAEGRRGGRGPPTREWCLGVHGWWVSKGNIGAGTRSWTAGTDRV